MFRNGYNKFLNLLQKEGAPIKALRSMMRVKPSLRTADLLKDDCDALTSIGFDDMDTISMRTNSFLHFQFLASTMEQESKKISFTSQFPSFRVIVICTF